jgi:hypothetical protein
MVYESLLNTGYEQVSSAYVQVRRSGSPGTRIRTCPRLRTVRRYCERDMCGCPPVLLATVDCCAKAHGASAIPIDVLSSSRDGHR